MAFSGIQATKEAPSRDPDPGVGFGSNADITRKFVMSTLPQITAANADSDFEIWIRCRIIISQKIHPVQLSWDKNPRHFGTTNSTTT
jgi:hypothetical protein